MQPIGSAIHCWRIEKGLTQEDLARDSGISRPNLSAIEQGSRDLTVRTLRRIAGALGINPGALVDGIGPKPQFAPLNMNRHSIDRVARLASGQALRATKRERKVAFALASIMKSKIRPQGIKQRRIRTARSENETTKRLKAELGPKTLNHLIRRVGKNLANNHE